MFAGVGERTCEGTDLYHEMIEGGVISLKDKTSKVALVYGQMNEPPGARARVALTGLTVAEYFRDQEGQDVLLFIDNIFRFTQVNSSFILCTALHNMYTNIRLVPRCLLCWVVSPPLWVTSPPWPLTWVACRRESPPPRRDPSPPCRPSTCPLTT